MMGNLQKQSQLKKLFLQQKVFLIRREADIKILNVHINVYES